MGVRFDRAAPHPVLAALDAADAALKEAADAAVVFMDPSEKREALRRVVRAESQLVALRLRVMAASDDVALNDGARDVAAWMSHEFRTDGGAARRDLALAQALDSRWHELAAGLTRGDVNPAQAHVIARALDDLPDDLSAELLAQAEGHLVSEAAHFGPRELRVLGRRVLDVIAPEVSEGQEAEALEREERQARCRTSLTSTRLGDGTTRFVIRVPDAIAARLRTYLEAFLSPRRRESGAADRVPADERRGQAFCSLLEAVDPRRLPVHGGDATTLIVTVPLESLRSGLGSGIAGPVDRLSAGEVRRLACTAQIIPAVMGGSSEVLDLGRASRLFKPAQRKAMVLRDQECRAEGCTVPAAWCEAHHWRQPWAAGGLTDLADGVLLCSWHHHRAHDPAYELSRQPDGDVLFRRRPGGSG